MKAHAARGRRGGPVRDRAPAVADPAAADPVAHPAVRARVADARADGQAVVGVRAVAGRVVRADAPASRRIPVVRHEPTRRRVPA